jgi:hypothetical protein
MDVARFFAYGLLGPEPSGFGSTHDNRALVLAANGIRLVLDEHRTTETPIRKDGTPGATKITYGEPEQAQAWLWKFVDGAKTAGELYGRVLVCFAAQHYARQTVLPASKRRSSGLPSSHKDQVSKAFAKLTKDVLPGSYTQLTKAVDRAAREHDRKVTALISSPTTATTEGQED